MDAESKKTSPSESQSRESNLWGYLDILLPSGLSAVVCVLLSAATLLAHNFSSIQHYFDLSTNWEIKKSVDEFLRHLLGVQRTNLIVSGLFWALVGIIVYIFFQGMVTILAELGHDLEERRYIRPAGADQNNSLKHTLRRGLFRVIVVVITLVYLNRVVGYFLREPGGHGNAIVYLGTSSAMVHTFKLFIGEFIALHGFVILLRLFFLKRRLITTI